MRLLATAKELLVEFVTVLAAVALAIGALEPAWGQPYYYAPPPDYYHNDTATDTVVGGAFGAITGAIIGGHSNRGEGALIGAGVGALTGNLLGKSKDRADERRAAYGAATVANLNQQAAASAISNYDLVSMTKAGVSDEVIISTLRSRGARLDLSPNGLISLKQSGVSDRVLLVAQEMSSGPSYVTPGPPTVIVAPAPGPYWYRPYRPYYRSHVYYHYHVR